MKFRNYIINMLDELAFLAIIVITIACAVFGLISNGFFSALMYGLSGFIGSCFTFGFWLCISGIYANVKEINEALKTSHKQGE